MQNPKLQITFPIKMMENLKKIADEKSITVASIVRMSVSEFLKKEQENDK